MTTNVSHTTKSAGVLTPAALARTYNPQAYADAWEVVEDYRRVQRAASRKPDRGSAALASHLDLPRGRIRPWLDDTVPDPVRAIQVGEDRGWFDDSVMITRAWAILVAGVYGGGSVDKQRYVPTWTLRPAAAANRIIAGLKALGVDATEVTRTADTKADELRVTEHGSVLGRALVTLGAPVGDKNAQTVDPIPDWLLSSPIQVRIAAAEVLVLYRGQPFPDKDTLSLFEGRSRQYRESVAALLGSVVEGRVTPGERYVTVSAAAARELGFGREGPLRAAIE